ncbi:hypothetical protein PT974_03905 [Cladobotryum mycophilum]|uniref:Uncharacterized protein n=1 Tax=Cladobotryum mycophilum TaxID=491253 RepID=A0ABR0STM1_9HYPO
MAAKVLSLFTLFIVFIGLAIASSIGESSPAAMMTSILHSHYKSIIGANNPTTAAALSSILPSLPMTGLPNIDAVNMISKEPGFILLSVAFGVITGGMAFL